MDDFSIGIQRTSSYFSPSAWLVPHPSETRICLRTEAVRKGFSGRVIDPHHVDYDYLRQRLRESSGGNGIPGTGSKPLPGLKVIACITKRIVFASDDCAYGALSYVWGQLSDSAPNTAVQTPLDKAFLGDDVPLTVKDAIVANRALRFQYLWVDKYCIDQTDEEEHACFVGHMDKIYNSAALTIVAAAGDSAHSGLPAVSSVPRQQKSINPGGLRYLILPEPVMEIRNSIWSSRG